MTVTEIIRENSYKKRFIPYAFAAFLVGIVGGFTTLLGPAFVNDLKLPYNNTAWTSLAMAISTATFAPVFGKTADAIGKRKTLLFALAVFTLGNVLTAISSSLPFMLTARFIVGMGSAAVAPVVMSFIVTTFPKEKTAKGFSVYMLISSASVIFGPTAGGFIIEKYGWRAMMWVCATISIVIFAVCFFTLEKDVPSNKNSQRFDVAGTVFILLFFGSVLCIPSFGQNLGWSSVPFFASFGLAVISGICLYFTEKKAGNPILLFSFIKRKAFVLSVTALFLTQGLMQANMTNIIFFVNFTSPQNSIISSYAISIMYIGMSLGAVTVGPLADRFEPKKVLSFSFLLTGVGCALLFLFSENTPLFILASSLSVLGFGLGGNATVFMKTVLSGVPSETVGAGTGTYGLFRDLAAPFGVAVFVPLFTNGVTAIADGGGDVVMQAVKSVKTLATAEIICVILGIITVMFLPKIHNSERGKI